MRAHHHTHVVDGRGHHIVCTCGEVTEAFATHPEAVRAWAQHVPAEELADSILAATPDLPQTNAAAPAHTGADGPSTGDTTSHGPITR